MEGLMKDWNNKCWEFESRISELWGRLDLSDSEKESMQLVLLDRFNSEMNDIYPSLCRVWKG